MPVGVSPGDQRSDGALPVLPWHQELVAHFTGRWPEGARPRWIKKPWWHLVTMGLSLLGGAAVSSVIVTAAPGYWPLLVLAWMITVHGARKGQVVMNHHAVHTNVTGRKRFDRALAEVISTLLVIQDYQSYFQDHVQIHHDLKTLATPADPDLQFLLRLGFQPGMSRAALWRRLYWTMVSPRFHGLFLRARLRANYVTAPVYRRLMAEGYALASVAGLALTGTWLPWLLVWAIPVFPLYHVAALLQFICEHKWLQVQGLATSEAPKEGA